MYCPVCFNPTLKTASNGVARMTFDGKSKSTSQFYYNTKQETPKEIYKKLEQVVEDYFKWYATFQNKGIIREVQISSSDFVCSNGCKLNINHKISLLGVLFDKPSVKLIVEKLAEKWKIDHNIENL